MFISFEGCMYLGYLQVNAGCRAEVGGVEKFGVSRARAYAQDSLKKQTHESCRDPVKAQNASGHTRGGPLMHVRQAQRCSTRSLERATFGQRALLIKSAVLLLLLPHIVASSPAACDRSKGSAFPPRFSRLIENRSICDPLHSTIFLHARILRKKKRATNSTCMKATMVT